MYLFDKSKDGIKIEEIHEDEPNRVIVTTSLEDERRARELFRCLKRGSGFAGWTPIFMLKTY